MVSDTFPPDVSVDTGIIAPSDMQIKVNILNSRGKQLYEATDFHAAILHFGQAIELDSTNAFLFSNRSAAYIAIKDYEQARQDAVKAIALKPEWAKARFRLGQALQGLGNIEASLYSYADGLMFEPSDKSCQQAIADIKAKRGEPRSVVKFEFLNYRNPCKECSLTLNGQEAVSFDGTVTMKCSKLQRYPGAGRVYPEGEKRIRVTDRFSRSLFLKNSSSHTKAYHALLKMTLELGRSIQQCLATEIILDRASAFEEEFYNNRDVLPELFLDIIKFAISDQRSKQERILLGQFIKECSQHQVPPPPPLLSQIL